jgi:DNA-binding MarR family transcriptional regulator
MRQGRRRATRATAERLHTAAIHLLRRLRAEDRAAGLSSPRLSALSAVVFGGPIRIGELAEAEQVRPATISRLVRDLERGGLVTRRRDRRDGRVHWIHATAEGRRLLHEARERRVARLARDLAALPSRDRRTLARAAEILQSL